MVVQTGSAVLELADSRWQLAGKTHRAAPDCIDDAGIDRSVVEARVAAMSRERRERSAFFPNRLFADPAWEILLALTLAHARQHRLDITKLCQRVDVPPTTVLRWINAMIEEGL